MKPIVHTLTILAAIACIAAAPQAVRADAMASMPGMAAEQTKTAGPYKLTLVLLPAEPYVTAAQVKASHLTSGMLAIRGAAPVQPGSATHPNHHLVVHVYRADGTAVQGAHVTMSVTMPSGSVMRVPVVEMQAVGKGPQSAHYGNNVLLAPGSYSVKITVGSAAAATFTITPM